jgi:hypothetical protein
LPHHALPGPLAAINVYSPTPSGFPPRTIV